MLCRNNTTCSDAGPPPPVALIDDQLVDAESGAIIQLKGLSWVGRLALLLLACGGQPEEAGMTNGGHSGAAHRAEPLL